MLKERWERALTFDAFLGTARSHTELWRELFRRARIPPELLQRAAGLRRRWHLLVLSEDWCGDAVNTVPVVARLAELSGTMELRLLARDQNPDLMDSHLSGS
ncbi:MAG TPA: thioredoxin family protein, partial [Longimicrobiales bacterium]